MAWVLGTLALFVGLGALYMIADVSRRVEFQLRRFREAQIAELENSIAGLAQEIKELESSIQPDDDLEERLNVLRSEIASEIGEIKEMLILREKEMSETP